MFRLCTVAPQQLARWHLGNQSYQTSSCAHAIRVPLGRCTSSGYEKYLGMCRGLLWPLPVCMPDSKGLESPAWHPSLCPAADMLCGNAASYCVPWKWYCLRAFPRCTAFSPSFWQDALLFVHLLPSGWGFCGVPPPPPRFPRADIPSLFPRTWL
jgi:hypothetical protein